MTSEEIERHEERVRDRAAYLRRLADDFIAKGIAPEGSVVFRRSHIELVTRGYFVLSECYKKWRIKDAHLTQPAKIAALTACAIVVLRPFRPFNPTNAATFGEAYCNELFAADAASAILSVELDVSTPEWKDFWDRMVDILEAFPGETLEPMRIDHNLLISRPDHVHFRTIHDDDRPLINSLICIFELLCAKITAKVK